ncbi:MAG: histidine kinase, partial [Bacteroidota bacterium]
PYIPSMIPLHPVARFFLHRVTRNLLFWFFFAGLPVWLNWDNYGSAANFWTDIFYYLELAFLGYFNNYFLIPRLLDRGKVAPYTIIIFLITPLMAYVSLFHLTPLVSDYTSRLSHPWMTLYYDLDNYFFFVGTFTGAALVTRLAQERYRSRQLKTLQQETELSFLKAQINPHLLFNTLNMMYSHAQERSPVVPDLVVGLANSMRYALHEGQARRVPLPTEVRFLRDYTELQRLRLEDRARVEFRNEIAGADNYQVAPMLFIVLVENAFKYATANQVDNIVIQLHLLIISDHLYFRVTNSLDGPAPPPGKTGGIGLDNLRKRLRLIYGREQQLITRRQNDRYHAELMLPLDPVSARKTDPAPATAP